jgi:hypothetical protein
MEQQCEKPASHSHTPVALPKAIPMEVDAITTRAPKKYPCEPLTREMKEHCKLDKLCGYCASATCPRGVAANSALCPFVIAKEEAKKQGNPFREQYN